MITGRRNGRQPNEKMQEVLKKTIEDARAMTSKASAISIISLLIAAICKFSNAILCDYTEISAAREVSHAEDGPGGTRSAERRRDDRLSDGTSAARRDSPGVREHRRSHRHSGVSRGIAI